MQPSQTFETISGNLKTLAEISRPKENGGTWGSPYFTVQPSCNLMAVAIEEVLSAWYDYDWRHRRNGKGPCMCDALHRRGDRITLVEFKSGVLDGTELHRKLYDTILALMEHGCLTMDQCRDNVDYVVVRDPQAVNQSKASRIAASISAEVMKSPWKYPTQYRADLKLSNLKWIVHDVLTLSPPQFAAYIQEKGWTSMEASGEK